MYLVTAEEMRALDRLAMERFGLPGIVLMENAARSAVRAALEHWELKPPGLIFILAGAGQNGGDGWAMARIFSGLGFQVRIFAVNPQKIAGDAAVNAAIARSLGLPITEFEDYPSLTEPLLAGPSLTEPSLTEPPLTEPPWAEADLAVDALFGSGLNRPVTGPAAALLASLKRAKERLGEKLKILAADLPSGLSADTGRWQGPPCPADLTVTMGAPKVGLYLNPEAAGRIVVGDIGLTPAMLAQAPSCGRLSEPEELRPLLPHRPLDGHKGSFGHVLLAGGARGRTGALVLAAMGAARSGAGLTTALHPASLGPIYEAKLTETMTLELPEEEPGELSAAAGEVILGYCRGRQALLLGPGLGLGEGARETVRQVAAKAEIPLTLDADALTALAGRLDILRGRPQVILTPHPGEAARLLEISTAEVQADRLGTARRLAELSGATVILKGRCSLIYGPDGAFYLNPTGGPQLAVGGSGDLLAGLAAGLLAQGLEPSPAAALAAWVHGRAADLAAAELGPWGLTPADFAARLPQAWREIYTPGG